LKYGASRLDLNPPLEVRWSKGVVEKLNPKFQAPNLKVSGVRFQVSGRRNKNAETRNLNTETSENSDLARRNSFPRFGWKSNGRPPFYALLFMRVLVDKYFPKKWQLFNKL
jgi:hypothetical protein